MNRVTSVVPAKTMTVILAGVAVLALAAFAAQAILTAESPLGLEVEPVFVDELIPAAAPAPVVEPASGTASSLDIDFRQADNYRIVDQVSAIDASSFVMDVRQADNYRGFGLVDGAAASAIVASGLDIDIRPADNYRIVDQGLVSTTDASSLVMDVRQADNYRGFGLVDGGAAPAIVASGLEFDVRQADNYRIFTQE